MSEFEQPILDYLRGVTAESGSAQAVAADTALLDTGLLDSINLVRLVQFLEERFGVSIPDGDLGVELFATPATIATYLESRRA